MRDYDYHMQATQGSQPEGNGPEEPGWLAGEPEQPRPLADVLAEYMRGLRTRRALEDARLEAEYRAEMDRDYWS
jgi:hypothetical protein